MNSNGQEQKISIFDLDMLVFDFDRVFTDDLVTIHQDGTKSVTCSRTDSLGISKLLKYVELNRINVDIFVLSTETNPVVNARCKKLSLSAYSGIQNKSDFLKNRSLETGRLLTRTLYVGNDLNDLEAMSLCSYSYAPANAHPQIKLKSTKTFETSGGAGFVRELIEYLVPDLWAS
jgi:N-acylneuraminate cytidylyltransferase